MDERHDELPDDLQPNAISECNETGSAEKWLDAERTGKKIGIKQATISNFENNPDNTTLTTFFKILQSLELSMTLCETTDTAPESTDQQHLEW